MAGRIFRTKDAAEVAQNTRDYVNPAVSQSGQLARNVAPILTPVEILVQNQNDEMLTKYSVVKIGDWTGKDEYYFDFSMQHTFDNMVFKCDVADDPCNVIAVLQEPAFPKGEPVRAMLQGITPVWFYDGINTPIGSPCGPRMGEDPTIVVTGQGGALRMIGTNVGPATLLYASQTIPLAQAIVQINNDIGITAQTVYRRGTKSNTNTLTNTTGFAGEGYGIPGSWDTGLLEDTTFVANGNYGLYELGQSNAPTNAFPQYWRLHIKQGGQYYVHATVTFTSSNPGQTTVATTPSFDYDGYRHWEMQFLLRDTDGTSLGVATYLFKHEIPRECVSRATTLITTGTMDGTFDISKDDAADGVYLDMYWYYVNEFAWNAPSVQINYLSIERINKIAVADGGPTATAPTTSSGSATEPPTPGSSGGPGGASGRPIIPV